VFVHGFLLNSIVCFDGCCGVGFRCALPNLRFAGYMVVGFRWAVPNLRFAGYMVLGFAALYPTLYDQN
jgi:hypothetical protein